MDRRIRLKVPEDVMTAYKKDKSKIRRIEYCGKYAADKLEDELKDGNIVTINEDIMFLINVSKKDEVTSLPFVLSYGTFMENTLIELLGSRGISVDNKNSRQKEDMLIALQTAQYVLLKYPEEQDVAKLNELAVEQLKRTHPNRILNHNRISSMCDTFIKLGLGHIKIEYEKDKKLKEKVGG